MAMHRTSRSVITLVVALSILLVVPMVAGARALETPHSTLAVAESWLGAALDWFQDVLSGLHRGGRHPSPGAPTGIHAKGGDPGTCIDPQGNHYPPPCVY
jgi:hypothetical protein